MVTTGVSAYVTIVRDGDSFGSTVGEVRLAGVCAPERGRPGAEVAKQRLERLILHRTVVLNQRGRDSYGRIVAEVYVNGIHVNAAMRGYGYTCN